LHLPVCKRNDCHEKQAAKLSVTAVAASEVSLKDDGGVVQLESGKDLPNTCNADIQLSLPNIKLKKQI
jgi:hypothetical protein